MHIFMKHVNLIVTNGWMCKVCAISFDSETNPIDYQINKRSIPYGQHFSTQTHIANLNSKVQVREMPKLVKCTYLNQLMKKRNLKLKTQTVVQESIMSVICGVHFQERCTRRSCMFRHFNFNHGFMNSSSKESYQQRAETKKLPINY